MGDWKADIICLQETKLQGGITELVRQIWGDRWVKMACLEASGTRGGVMDDLERNFDEEEVSRSLKQCAVDKAPRPDGFTLGSYIKCWEVVKSDIMKTCQHFYDQRRFERSFNATSIALIPKKKLAFIKGRQIMDLVLIANEAIDYRSSLKKPGILCKLVIEKTYDHVNWDFLTSMLEKMGFDLKWRQCIKFCISRALDKGKGVQTTSTSSSRTRTLIDEESEEQEDEEQYNHDQEDVDLQDLDNLEEE
ncbi:hypothetical protein H5410_058041 [Solanum commersonii]|uniref:Reverse transcriptase domain-containing protein n=1 Tax=Solanum commersonii TaxID=4109 RepID=A0A9J5WPK6_SOLCO|nr:hypothetical protein H5410_058041 [Solanum commersonii]